MFQFSLKIFLLAVLCANILFANPLFASPAKVETVRVAVAANFYAVMSELVESFQQCEGYPVELVVGSSGKLSSQIIQGAPFDLFLSADVARPVQLEEREKIVAGSRKTYAKGRLALLTGKREVSGSEQMERLKSDNFARLAIANPDLSPYGRAAEQTLKALGLTLDRGKLIYGENVSQAFHFMQTGHADLAFVSQSQIIEEGVDSMRFSLIPENYHEPIEQQMVLLSDSMGAADLYRYLLSEPVQSLVSQSGYHRAH